MDLLAYAIEERGSDITDKKNWLGPWSIINVALLEGDTREHVKWAILKIVNKMWLDEEKVLKREGLI